MAAAALLMLGSLQVINRLWGATHVAVWDTCGVGISLKRRVNSGFLRAGIEKGSAGGAAFRRS
tara:strand:- start:281 stop:469 length:189 start_codon:yes stop_codon:yes gene_type:complete